MNKVTARLLFIGLLLLTCAACGPNKGISAPSGSTIAINPTTISYTAVVSAGSDTSSQGWQSTSFLITLTDSNGDPVNNATLHITFDTLNDYIQFYDGEATTGYPFDATTDAYGTYSLRFDFEAGGGLTYSGNIEVSSGTAYNSVPISVQ
jgi:hypothetical protein